MDGVSKIDGKADLALKYFGIISNIQIIFLRNKKKWEN